jgi:hypothetical protein
VGGNEGISQLEVIQMAHVLGCDDKVLISVQVLQFDASYSTFTPAFVDASQEVPLVSRSSFCVCAFLELHCYLLEMQKEKQHININRSQDRSSHIWTLLMMKRNKDSIF